MGKGRRKGSAKEWWLRRRIRGTAPLAISELVHRLAVRVACLQAKSPVAFISSFLDRAIGAGTHSFTSLGF